MIMIKTIQPTPVLKQLFCSLACLAYFAAVGSGEIVCLRGEPRWLLAILPVERSCPRLLFKHTKAAR